METPVVAPCKAGVCGRYLAVIAGSNPALTRTSVCCECGVLSGEVFAIVQRSPTSVVCLSVIMKPRREGLGALGLSRREKIEVGGAGV